MNPGSAGMNRPLRAPSPEGAPSGYGGRSQRSHSHHERGSEAGSGIGFEVAATAGAGAGAGCGARPTDADLLRSLRDGEPSAYDELYRRHVRSVRRYARTCCRSWKTADALADEVFARMLWAVRGGKGPQTSVRAYLLASVRPVATGWARSEQRDQLDGWSELFRQAPVIEPSGVRTVGVLSAGVRTAAGARSSDEQWSGEQTSDEPPSGTQVEDDGEGPSAEENQELGADVLAILAAERTLVVQAFNALSAREQAVLWHTTIEEGRQRPAHVAPMPVLTEDAAATAARSARENLRRAYLQAHIHRSHTCGGDCARYSSQLDEYARGGLRARAKSGMRKHLERCPQCRAAAAEVIDLNERLRVLAPVAFLGWFASDGGAEAFGALLSSTSVTEPTGEAETSVTLRSGTPDGTGEVVGAVEADVGGDADVADVTGKTDVNGKADVTGSTDGSGGADVSDTADGVGAGGRADAVGQARRSEVAHRSGRSRHAGWSRREGRWRQPAWPRPRSGARLWGRWRRAGAEGRDQGTPGPACAAAGSHRRLGAALQVSAGALAAAVAGVTLIFALAGGRTEGAGAGAPEGAASSNAPQPPGREVEPVPPGSGAQESAPGPSTGRKSRSTRPGSGDLGTPGARSKLRTEKDGSSSDARHGLPLTRPKGPWRARLIAGGDNDATQTSGGPTSSPDSETSPSSPAFSPQAVPSESTVSTVTASTDPTAVSAFAETETASMVPSALPASVTTASVVPETDSTDPIAVPVHVGTEVKTETASAAPASTASASTGSATAPTAKALAGSAFVTAVPVATTAASATSTTAEASASVSARSVRLSGPHAPSRPGRIP